MKAKRVMISIFILIIIFGSGLFISLKNNQDKLTTSNSSSTNVSGYMVRGTFTGEEVTTAEEAQSKLSFKFSLPKILGNPDKILVEEGYKVTIIYGYKGDNIFEESPRFISENGGIIIYEYKPGLEREVAESLIDGGIKQMDLYDDTRGTQQRIYINGFPGVMGGNVAHCVTWFTPEATYTVGGSLAVPLEELVKIAESMDVGN
jgi:hypothetical protein